MINVFLVQSVVGTASCFEVVCRVGAAGLLAAAVLFSAAVVSLVSYRVYGAVLRIRLWCC